MKHLSATMRAKTTLWMCVALAAGILAAWLVVVLGTPTKPAEAAFPGKNGKIAFVSGFGDRDSEIGTMKANGDNQTQLTNNDHVDDFDPAYSPNGRKIAFASDRSGNRDLYTMSANGTDKKRLTTSKSFDINPAWSPDGTRIAFLRGAPNRGNRDIYVINKDGTGLTRLTTSQLADKAPAWSPDGTKIAFERGFLGRIFVMKAARVSETNRPKRVTTGSSNTLWEQDPAWSPDGTWIAYSRLLDGVSDIYAIRPDGSGQIQLTTCCPSPFLGENDPAWSPDGTKIAFSRGNAIFVMKAAPESETNRPKRLTGDVEGLPAPDWQPLR